MSLLPLVLLAAASAGPGHEDINPLYRELLRTGIPVGDGRTVPLPAPTMADGLSARAQQAVLERLAGQDYQVEELTRRSAVAPYILRLRDVKPSDTKAPVRGVDFWFVAYGSLDRVADEEFLSGLLKSNRKEGSARALKSAELARRGITLSPAAEKHESYGRVVFPFLDRVELSVTGRSFWTRADDSVVVAARIDPRFEDDPEFPNRWRPLARAGGGKPRPGAAHPYRGAGYYLKITRLARPAGALFAEAHLVFTEPVGWFNGANLLRSKLPPVVQSQVRSARRELLRATRAAD